jgi:hypothetical protein
VTHQESRNGKSQPSGSARKEKIAGSALLAAVSILSASLGVTAAQSAVEVTAADGSSTHDFNTKLAATIQSNQAKGHNPPVLQSDQKKGDPVGPKPVSKGFSFSPSGPQAKPKR